MTDSRNCMHQPIGTEWMKLQCILPRGHPCSHHAMDQDIRIYWENPGDAMVIQREGEPQKVVYLKEGSK